MSVTDRPILAHFHEWMAGVGGARIAHLRLPGDDRLTTHATLLGRYLAAGNPYFYGALAVPQTATPRRTNIKSLPRHLIEKRRAHSSTVFTTVRK